MDPHLVSVVLNEEDLALIQRLLQRLVEDTAATQALVLDKSGQVIASEGTADPEDVTALGALLAGNFASSREVARLLKEKDFRTFLQQGVRENIYTSLVGEQWILAIIFERGTHVGLVKVLANKVVEQLEKILEHARKARRQGGELLKGFRASMEDTIDLLFKD